MLSDHGLGRLVDDMQGQQKLHIGAMVANSEPHLLHFLLDLCMHHCKLGCILHLSCAEATHGLQDAMSVAQCSIRVRAQLKRDGKLKAKVGPDLSE